MIRSSYSQAIADQKLNPAGGPRIEAVPGDDAGRSTAFHLSRDVRGLSRDHAAAARAARARGAAGRARRRRRRRDDREAAHAARHLAPRRASGGRRRSCVVDFEGKIDGARFRAAAAKTSASCSAAGRCSRSSTGRCTARRPARPGRRRSRSPPTIRRRTWRARTRSSRSPFSASKSKCCRSSTTRSPRALASARARSRTLPPKCARTCERELAERLSRDTKARVFDALIKANSIERSARARRAGHRRAAAGCDARARSQRSRLRPRRGSDSRRSRSGA